MSDGVTYDITGLGDLQLILKTVSEEISVKATNTAGRKAAQLIARAAAANALRLDDPETGEQIAKNIWLGGAKYPGVRKKSKRSTPKYAIAYRVGVAGGAKQYANTAENRRKRRAGKKYETLGDKKNPGGDTFYWRFLEFGTENSKATPFLRPAMQENIQAATNVFVSEYRMAIDKQIAKRAKQIASRGKFQQFRRRLAGLQ